MSETMADASVIWRRLDRPGHEAARLSFEEGRWRLTGTAVFAAEGRPCRLDYRVVCDRDWATLSGWVAGWLGADRVELAVEADGGRWRLDGVDCAAVAGATDLDFEFSPATNLLPIRRLGLAVGAQAPVRAAWLRFPSFTLEPLDQLYRRTGDATYRYESGGGRFAAELQVDAAGFVVDYPGGWRMEGGAPATDEDLEKSTRDELAAEVRRLRQGIRKHRDSTGHELCWHHPALWGLLPEASDPLPTVPEWPQFLEGCIRYRRSLDEQAPHAPRTAEPFASRTPGSGSSR